jgi:hypothetical protein
MWVGSSTCKVFFSIGRLLQKKVHAARLYCAIELRVFSNQDKLCNWTMTHRVHSPLLPMFVSACRVTFFLLFSESAMKHRDDSERRGRKKMIDLAVIPRWNLSWTLTVKISNASRSLNFQRIWILWCCYEVIEKKLKYPRRLSHDWSSLQKSRVKFFLQLLILVLFSTFNLSS